MDQLNWNRAFERTPEKFTEGLHTVLEALPEQEERTMKLHKKLRRTIVLAAAAVMVLGGAVFAASEFRYIRSDAFNTYDLKDAAAVEEVIAGETIDGITADAKFLETYSNGFTMTKATVDGVEARSEENPEEIHYQELWLHYCRENASLTVTVEPDMGYTVSDRSMEVPYGDVTLYTLVQDYKCVNEDYEMTPEDRAAETDGTLIFSYDNSLTEPELYQQRYVCWTEDGMHYSIDSMDSLTELDELVQMAQELIDSK